MNATNEIQYVPFKLSNVISGGTNSVRISRGISQCKVCGRTRMFLPGIATEDGVVAHFINEKLSIYVSSHPDKKAYSVEPLNGVIKEEIHQPKFIGEMGLKSLS